MTGAAAAPDGNTSRQALAAGIGCYIFWGLLPALFMLMNHAGATPWEILGERTLWAAPWSAGLVILARHQGEVRRVLREPRTLGLLTVSALLIGINWSTYVWAVGNGRTLDAALGYYIIPLFNMAVGAMMFRERIDRFGLVAIALAAVGVAVQTVAVGKLPLISLVLAISFGGYGVIRKQVRAEAQTGLFVECVLMSIPGLIYVVWLHHAGGGIAWRGVGPTLLMAVTGPATVVPLALFAWAARRLPLSTVGFLQFIGPTMSFFVGLYAGEPMTPLRALSFVFIWAGAAAFALGAWRAGRRLAREAAIA
ncbi:EamA family transporter RarD [Caulobacter sp. KR2-114]|uniref:EamA family transporter RarD n=1 Tax=Caulobacter sp. KR2-114 TaxID=3400912 RepID=UPI003C037BA2